MAWVIGLGVVAVLLVGAVVAGVLIGRKNKKLVEGAVSLAKDPKGTLTK